ncbi:uncharacterized protein TRIADDRAFT_30823 [Trichoplax adhaerens]|uniref:Galactose-1-phosphate uridylyltransferase n=1 Tax=Trichoplax adhaerens TaxID=10228 RepID=B3S7Z6_TRIAD|nr:hypothetical protein TRIADDRAFT_30823 [Trichoplax adhaerens]EDV21102.1 hypothetical protein TRIADDRAFT_30823 [Trichoplax adhaerens]|eukprot:XP_002116432.1 hypothetical protein TRIADDRAFT_30823 [Trichoplax adhaerens]
MATSAISDTPHLRFNPLRQEWVIVSPQRLSRPWQGRRETSEKKNSSQINANNALAPGGLRPNGIVNPNYDSTYVFTNDFPALIENFDCDHPLLRNAVAQGNCRVMCFHPRSDLTLPLMTETEILAVINKWSEEFEELGRKFNWVQIFENKGEIMGCSNPHPHCQIWSSNFIPNDASLEDKSQKNYYEKNGKVMLLEYAELELKKKTRIVVENNQWVALVPYWAMWPFEIMLLPKRHIKRFTELTEDDKAGLAECLKKFLTKYDNLFETSFPYSMGWLGAPTGSYLSQSCEHWQLHAHYYPPLLRSATVKKFMAGYEMVASPQRDLTAEMAAERLRNLPDIHYKLV